MTETAGDPKAAVKALGALFAAAVGLAGGYFGYRLAIPAAPAAPPAPAATAAPKEPPPKPPRYRYDLHITPYGASVAIDGEVVGQAPLVLSFAPTAARPDYSVEVSAPGYVTWKRKLTPTRDDELTVSLTPEAVPEAPSPDDTPEEKPKRRGEREKAPTE
jgi:hypothetical protein